MLKLVIFDFDGVIANTLGIVVNVANKLILKEFPPSRRITVTSTIIRNSGLRELIKQLKVPARKVPYYLLQGKREVRKDIHLAKPFPQLRKVMNSLHTTYQLGIVTSNSKENVQIFLEANKMTDYFDFVIVEAGIFGKARRIKKLLKDAKVAPNEAVYIGDELRDVEAAQSAGIPVIAASWGFSAPELLIRGKPDYLIDQPKRIPDIIKHHERKKNIL